MSAMPTIRCATERCPHGALVRIDEKSYCTLCAPRHSLFASSLGMPGRWDAIEAEQADADRRVRDAGIKPTTAPLKTRVRRRLSGEFSLGKRDRGRDPAAVKVMWFFRPRQVALGARNIAWRKWAQSSASGTFYRTEFRLYLPLYVVTIKLYEQRPPWTLSRRTR